MEFRTWLFIRLEEEPAGEDEGVVVGVEAGCGDLHAGSEGKSGAAGFVAGTDLELAGSEARFTPSKVWVAAPSCDARQAKKQTVA